MNRSMSAVSVVSACSVLAALLASGSSCSRNSKHPRQSFDTGANDALWALAPEGTKAGVVIAPGTGPLLAAAWAEVERSASRWPAMQKAMAELRSEAPAEVFDDAARARMGLDITSGAAVFMFSADEGAMVLPVVDRAAFRKRIGATTEEVDGTTVDVLDELRCQDVAGHYACAESATRLATMGKSDAWARRVAARPAALRGSVEFELAFDYLEPEQRQEIAAILADATTIQGAFQLSPGVVSMRAFVGGKPSHPLAQTALQTPDTLAKQLARSQPGGFLHLRVPLDAMTASGVAAGARALGLTIDASALSGITGEVVLASASGDVLDVSLQIGARDGKALQPLVAQLCQMAQGAGAPVPVAMEEERCVARIDPKLLEQAGLPAGMAFERPLEISLATSATALIARVTMPGQTKAERADMTDLGRELLDPPWHVALWSHGTMLRTMQSMPATRPAQMLAALPTEIDGAAEIAKGVLWGLAHLDEMGWGAALRDDGLHLLFHVGTHWANPDDVLRAYQALLDRMLTGADIEADLAALAAKHEDTPLGRAYEAGPGGFAVLMGATGVSAAVAIPAFMRYIEKAKSSEAEQLVRRIVDGARAHYHNPPQSGLTPEPKHVPRESVGPTPPAGACCASGDGKCAPDPALWSHPTWQALNFSIEDPHYYSYQYEVLDGGKAFVARAIGDLDCDGVLSTFELEGRITEDGSVEVSPSMRRIDETE
jgi:hypothetical protein